MKEDGVHLVALDGFRIALRKMNLPTEHRGSYIIPGRTLSEINKITDDDQIVSLFADKGNMSFSFGDTIVNTRLLEGQFIQYETLLQADSSVVFETGKKDLYDALERASLLAGEDRANLIKLCCRIMPVPLPPIRKWDMSLKMWKENWKESHWRLLSMRVIC